MAGGLFAAAAAEALATINSDALQQTARLRPTPPPVEQDAALADDALVLVELVEPEPARRSRTRAGLRARTRSRGGRPSSAAAGRDRSAHASWRLAAGKSVTVSAAAPGSATLASSQRWGSGFMVRAYTPVVRHGGGAWARSRTPQHRPHSQARPSTAHGDPRFRPITSIRRQSSHSQAAPGVYIASTPMSLSRPPRPPSAPIQGSDRVSVSAAPLAAASPRPTSAGPRARRSLRVAAPDHVRQAIIGAIRMLTNSNSASRIKVCTDLRQLLDSLESVEERAAMAEIFAIEFSGVPLLVQLLNAVVDNERFNYLPSSIAARLEASHRRNARAFGLPREDRADSMLSVRAAEIVPITQLLLVLVVASTEAAAALAECNGLDAPVALLEAKGSRQLERVLRFLAQLLRSPSDGALAILRCAFVDAGGLACLMQLLASLTTARDRTRLLVFAALRGALAACPQAMDAFLEAHGPMRVLAHMSGSSMGVKAAAANTLGFACMEDARVRAALAAASGVPAFVALVKARQSPAAFSALAEICSGSSVNVQAAAAAGALQVLVRTLRRPSRATAVHVAAVNTLMALVDGQPQLADAAGETTLIRDMINMLDRDDLVESVGAALVILAREHVNNAARLEHYVPLLVTYLEVARGAARQAAAAADILAAMATRAPFQRTMMHEALLRVVGWLHLATTSKLDEEHGLQIAASMLFCLEAATRDAPRNVELVREMEATVLLDSACDVVARVDDVDASLETVVACLRERLA
ncbi:uncharacterized protein AMSG_07158 [Thecamonas trahens ATCC 50062]|uniref:Uncharacterized protein n=1 Tax=Thecamonas trahens ATCC 50062 TaxID=461836 RepID=A0A0L0DFH8_THETB|nr:hypothetical protein AMSG_07158 [Thecamonas trahens ATCC 50062]KNC50916.1 hypothetical protein AMSG_07158 [Thecamonas trahens ATCC 50062]|eukprot:XP_013756616.1 hypothetical protein AMSG_07158 [Thecamonas trahens ATCC 50062]